VVLEAVLSSMVGRWNEEFGDVLGWGRCRVAVSLVPLRQAMDAVQVQLVRTAGDQRRYVAAAEVH
jgi:hypothetical protein